MGIYKAFAMIKIVLYNKNALNIFATMTPISCLTSVYDITQQDQHIAIHNLWPNRLLMFITCYMQLYCYLLSSIVWLN